MRLHHTPATAPPAPTPTRPRRFRVRAVIHGQRHEYDGVFKHGVDAVLDAIARGASRVSAKELITH